MLRLNELRTLKSITQQELAKEIGVKNYTIANWEQGRAEPSIQDLIALANVFECSIDYLVGREDELGNIKISRVNESDTLNLFNKLPKHKKEIIEELIADIYKSL